MRVTARAVSRVVLEGLPTALHRLLAHRDVILLIAAKQLLLVCPFELFTAILPRFLEPPAFPPLHSPAAEMAENGRLLSAPGVDSCSIAGRRARWAPGGLHMPASRWGEGGGRLP
jgi:hypothetical protein